METEPGLRIVARNERPKPPHSRGSRAGVLLLDIIYGAGTAGVTVDGILKSNAPEAALGAVAFSLPVGYLLGRAIALRSLGH